MYVIVEVQRSQNLLLIRKLWVKSVVLLCGFMLTLIHFLTMSTTGQLRDFPFTSVCLSSLEDLILPPEKRKTIHGLKAYQLLSAKAILIQSSTLVLYNVLSIVFLIYITRSLHEKDSSLKRSFHQQVNLLIFIGILTFLKIFSIQIIFFAPLQHMDTKIIECKDKQPYNNK